MIELALFVRCVLSAIFLVAGVAKLVDLSGSRQSMREFGVPSALVGSLALALPLAEVVCAGALLTGAFAWWAAIGAVTLLTTFIIGIVVNLARGRTPDCHCFGKLHSEPVGWGTVARNGVLTAMALFVIAQGPGNVGPGLVEWFVGLSGVHAALLLLTLAVASLAVGGVTVFFHLLAQNGRLMLRVEALEAKTGGRSDPKEEEKGLAFDTPAPAFNLTGVDEIPVSLEVLSAMGKPLLLVFTEPNCSACDAVLPDVARWQQDQADRLLIVPIGNGDMSANKAKAVAHSLQHMLVQEDREVGGAYRVTATPSAVLVKDGLVASKLVVGPDAIRDLVFEHTLPSPVRAGETVPGLQLRDLEGMPSDIAATEGRRRVLLFWNPTCGFCKSMLNDVKSWERTRSRTAPELVVISAGTVDSNRDQAFKSRVVIDPVFGAGKVFGATGTPSAVTIDEQGRVASDVGVGAPAVMAMLKARTEAATKA